MPLCPEGYRKQVEAMGWTKEIKALAIKPLYDGFTISSVRRKPVLDELVAEGLVKVHPISEEGSDTIIYVYSLVDQKRNPG